MSSFIVIDCREVLANGGFDLTVIHKLGCERIKVLYDNEELNCSQEDIFHINLTSLVEFLLW